MNQDMENVGVVKCTNQHQYFGVTVGPCPICGAHTEMSDEQLIECSAKNRILPATELVGIKRSNKMREIPSLAQQAARNCYVQGTSDMVSLENLIACVAHMEDRIDIIQHNIKTEYDRQRNAR